jgi:hypothetical protein
VSGFSRSASDKDKNVEILFTGNAELESKCLLRTYTYFKTNRYSKIGLLYEWDFYSPLKNEAKYLQLWDLVKASVN